jgi:hypothetical protein
MATMREFDTGATRDGDEGKYDYEGFLSPLVIERYGQYMHKHRKQADGGMRESDNWQKGIPLDAYIKSAWRHFFEWWAAHRGWRDATDEMIEDSLCALMFNVMGCLHEYLKKGGSMTSREVEEENLTSYEVCSEKWIKGKKCRWDYEQGGWVPVLAGEPTVTEGTNVSGSSTSKEPYE